MCKPRENLQKTFIRNDLHDLITIDDFFPSEIHLQKEVMPSSAHDRHPRRSTLSRNTRIAREPHELPLLLASEVGCHEHVERVALGRVVEARIDELAHHRMLLAAHVVRNRPPAVEELDEETRDALRRIDLRSLLCRVRLDRDAEISPECELNEVLLRPVVLHADD